MQLNTERKAEYRSVQNSRVPKWLNIWCYVSTTFPFDYYSLSALLVATILINTGILTVFGECFAVSVLNDYVLDLTRRNEPA